MVEDGYKYRKRSQVHQHTLSSHQPMLLLTFTANWKSDQKLPVDRTPSCTRIGVGLPCLSSPPLKLSFMVVVVVGLSWSPSGGAADADDIVFFALGQGSSYRIVRK